MGEPHRPMRAINVTTFVNSSVVAGVSAVTAPKPKSSVTEIVRARMSILRCENVDLLSAPADKVAYAQPAIHFFSRIRRHRLSLLLRPSPR